LSTQLFSYASATGEPPDYAHELAPQPYGTPMGLSRCSPTLPLELLSTDVLTIIATLVVAIRARRQ
jgi:hypothetical protein